MCLDIAQDGVVEDVVVFVGVDGVGQEEGSRSQRELPAEPDARVDQFGDTLVLSGEEKVADGRIAVFSQAAR